MSDIQMVELKCKSCGGNIGYNPGDEYGICFNCDTEYLMSDLKGSNEQQNSYPSEMAVQNIRIDGISSASSAVAYIDEYIEDYDWESYITSRDFEVAELNKVVKKMKSSYADDKNTWISAYKVLYICYKKKVEGCYSLLRGIISEYSSENDDIYSKFDSYKFLVSSVKKRYEKTVEQLEGYTAKAEKYGAEAEEIASLKAKTEEFETVLSLKEYDRLESIPAVAKAMEAENRRIAQELAAQGINADMVYERAVSLENSGNHADALNLLYTLKGYKNSHELARRIDKYFLIGDVLEISGKLYYYKRHTDSTGASDLSLYPFSNGMVGREPLVTGIGRVVTNFADRLYYLNNDNRLHCYDFSAAKGREISDKRFDVDNILFPKKRGKIYPYTFSENDATKKELFELDLYTGNIKSHYCDDFTVKYWDNENLVIEQIVEINNKTKAYLVRELDIETLEYTDICVSLDRPKIKIEAFYNGNVIYTESAPDVNNRDLYIKKLRDSSAPKLLEANILRYIETGDNRLFYSIGSDRRSTLVTLDLGDGTRCQMVSYIDTVLYQKGEWLYFTRSSGSNTALCRCRVDGTKYTCIADNIKKTVEFKNGYLYYINKNNSLISVRMDGTNRTHLCNNVENDPVLREDKMVFLSSDYMNKSAVKRSIYAVDHQRGGLIKLAYDVINAKSFENEMVYFINRRKKELLPGETPTYDSNGAVIEKYIETLYRIDLNTNTTEQLMILETEPEEPAKSYTAIVIMACFLIVFFIGLAAGSAGLAVMGVIGAVISLIVYFMENNNINSDTN